MFLRTFADCRSVLTDPQIPSVNKVPYHVPVEEEGYRRLLNGDWDFHYYDSVLDIPDDVTSISFSDRIPVPSNWAMHGYDIPRYINTRYGWEPDVLQLHPPRIPQEHNSCGVYRTMFTLPEAFAGRRTLISFEGAESGLFVFLNGQCVGYSGNGRSAADFDLTEALVPGENVLVAIVTLWCAGSWMEAQDMWRLGGIIRDVSLYSVPHVHIGDWFAWSRFENGYEQAFLELECKVMNRSGAAIEPYTVRAVLRDGTDSVAVGEGQIGNQSHRFREESMGIVTGIQLPLEAGCTGTAYIEIPVEQPKLWSAEIPSLYDVELSLLDAEGKVLQVLSFRHGFREIVQEGCSIRLNGKELLLRGVNRHEFSPAGGHVVTREEMVQDIRLMKRHNVNAVRSSHYPDCQYWYDLCDEYGLYVMDEANVESHCLSYRRNLLPGNDALWYNAYLDRIASMVQCDKNHASIIMWSMGNELGFGENIAFAAAYCRAYDPTRLIHKRQMHCVADMDSETYPTPADMLSRVKQFPDRPYVCNEYGHAMGNAMGSLGEYWKWFREIPQLHGGYIWEWADHGIRTEKGFIYGGDSGEAFHDGNFCIDGLVTPDRKVTPKLIELKKVQEYIRFAMIDSRTIEVRNEYDFLPLDGFNLELSVLQDGESIYTRTLSLIDIGPDSVTKLKLHLPEIRPLPGAEYVLDLKAVYAEDTPFCPAGYEAAHTTFVLEDLAAAPLVYPAPAAKPAYEETEDACRILAGPAVIVFDRKTGWINCYESNGHPLSGEVVPSFFRAPTDNDVRSSFIRGERNWYAAGLKNPVFTLLSMEIREEPQSVLVTTRHQLGGITVASAYHVDGAGRIFLEQDVHADETVPTLARIGLRIHADSALQQSVWYGFGEETYVDRKEAGRLGRYEQPVSSGHEAFYIRPQEYDDHLGCRLLAVQGQAAGLALVSPEPISMKAIPYTSEQFDEADHLYELPAPQEVYLYADAFETGLGNASCGAEVFPPYQLVPGHYRYSIALVPFGAGEDPVSLKNIAWPLGPSVKEPLPGMTREVLYHRYRDPSDPDVRASLGYSLP